MQIKNGDTPAMPAKTTLNRETGKFEAYQFGNNDFEEVGLTKREQFAMASMQGFCADGQTQGVDVPKMAVEMADALLAELEK